MVYYLILKDNSTDEILNLVERSGSDGYRVYVYREIMAEYSRTDLKIIVKQLLIILLSHFKFIRD